jgi:TrpR-related protein YerC/YecD
MDWKKPENKKLVEAVLALESPDEARRFLRDLMTAGEINEFGRRLAAAEMLSRKVPYTTIEKETGFSSTTVARISKWLRGDLGGYRFMIDRLHYHGPHPVRKGSC